MVGSSSIAPRRTAVRGDFDFLDGWFEVVNRRLRNPVDPASGWYEFPATARAIVLLDGAVSIDEMWFPEQRHYGMSLRVHDPVAREWSVYWIDSRRGRIEPAVRGRWQGGRCWLTGSDHVDGTLIDFSYSWHDLDSADGSAEWEQCFSVDHGLTWQPNWQMSWLRRDSEPDHGCAGLRTTSDFDFLAGTWQVRHRRDVTPLAEHADRHEFDGAQRGWTFFEGSISVDEVDLAEPGHRGLTFRVYDPHAGSWSIFWVNSRVGALETPVCGTFAGGIGTFESHETIDGNELDVRFTWDEITTSSARWRQEFSFDRGGSWRENWEMRLVRTE